MPTLYKCISFTRVEVPWGERPCLTHLHIWLFFISPNLTLRILQSFVHNRCLIHFCWPCWALYEYFVELILHCMFLEEKSLLKVTYWLRWKSYVRSIVISIQTSFSPFSFHPFLLEFHSEHITKLLSRHPVTQIHEVSLNQIFLWLGHHSLKWKTKQSKPIKMYFNLHQSFKGGKALLYYKRLTMTPNLSEVRRLHFWE